MSKQEVIPPPGKGASTRSLRGVLRAMTALRRQAQAGQRSVLEADRLHAMADREGNVILRLQELQMRNCDRPVVVDLHPGEVYEEPELGVHRKTRVRVTRGQDKAGQLISTTQVTVDANIEDERLESDAEVKALT